MPFRRRTRRSAELLGYRPGPGDDQITILYGQDADDEPGEARVLEHDARQVRVQVTYVFAQGWQLLILCPREVVLTLGGPLGNRAVVDETGQHVPRVPDSAAGPGR